jgi:hypothetical protein
MLAKTNIRSGWFPEGWYPNVGYLGNWYPDGSYTRTCRSITYDPQSMVLNATCKQKDGAWNSASLYLPRFPQDIVNCDGILTTDRC